MERQLKHDIGYWMTILGFASTIMTVFAGVLLQIDINLFYQVVFGELIIFIVGIELALRNQKHHEHFP